MGIILFCAAVSMPWWGNSGWMREVVEIASYLVYAMMWNLLAGYAGMVSIGQQAFLGLGGYFLLIDGSVAGRDGVVSIDQGAIKGSRRSNPV